MLKGIISFPSNGTTLFSLPHMACFCMAVPVLEGEPAVRINDVYGKTSYYILDRSKVEYEV